MIDNSFIKEICDSKIVYLLKSDEGFATSVSQEYEYEDESALEVICFWSERELAEKAIQNDWAKHKIEELQLSIFLEQWLLGMFEEVCLAGIDFDENLKGTEKQPLDLILEIIFELNQTNKNIQFQNFSSLEELKKLVLELKTTY